MTIAVDLGRKASKQTKQMNTIYNSFLVYCRELGPGNVSLTGDRAQDDDSTHDSHYTWIKPGVV